MARSISRPNTGEIATARPWGRAHTDDDFQTESARERFGSAKAGDGHGYLYGSRQLSSEFSQCEDQALLHRSQSVQGVADACGAFAPLLVRGRGIRPSYRPFVRERGENVL
jgi:hypothetical protein